MLGELMVGLRRDELSGEDKKALGDIIQKLKAAKKEIDDRTVAFGAGQGPIGWADLLALAAKVAVQKEWVRTKVGGLRHTSCVLLIHGIQPPF
jgi:hypothetical protein